MITWEECSGYMFEICNGALTGRYRIAGQCRQDGYWPIYNSITGEVIDAYV